MAECYLHNQFPKIESEISLTLRYHIQYGSKYSLYIKYGDIEKDPDAEGLEYPAVNTIWICVGNEDTKITKITTVSDSFPAGEEGLCVFWTSSEGLCNKVYVWDADAESWVNAEAYIFTASYRWIKFASLFDGEITDWKLSFSSANGYSIYAPGEMIAISKGGDSRFITKNSQRIAEYDYLEIEGCYATSDMTIGFLKLSDLDYKNNDWGTKNFVVNYTTITAEEFAEVDEDEGINVRIPIPKPPINYWQTGNLNYDDYAFYYYRYYIGIFVGSLNNPMDTYASFKRVWLTTDLTGDLRAPYSAYKTKTTPIGGITKNYDDPRIASTL